jgi:hypothetical protein
VERGELAPRLPIPRRPKMRSRNLTVARDAGVTAVQCRMAALEGQVFPLDPHLLEAKLSKRRAAAREWEESRADVMNEARQRELLRAKSTTGTPGVGLQHEHSKAAPGQSIGRHEPVRARTDHDDVRVSHVWTPPYTNRHAARLGFP